MRSRADGLARQRQGGDMESGAIVGAEAFVRWRYPERGLILTGQFVPIAEVCGLPSAVPAASSAR